MLNFHTITVTTALLFLQLPIAQAFLNPPQTLKVGEYTFEITEMLVWDSEDEQGRPVEGLRIYLSVIKGDSQKVFDGQGGFYFFGDPDDPQNKNLTNGTDLTGDGEPDIVVAERTYDAKNNLKLWVFSVGKDFKLIKTIVTAQDGIPSFPGNNAKKEKDHD